MNEQVKENEVHLQDLWTVVKRCWALMLAVFVVATVSLYIVFSVAHEDEYTATVSVWALRSLNTENGAGNTSTSDVSISNALVEDYIRLITTYGVRERVIQKMELNATPEQLNQLVQIKNETGTRIIQISITTDSPITAKEIADAWGAEFCSYINDDLMDGQSMIKVVEAAVQPKEPSNPVSLIKVLLIAFICAVAVYGVYFVRFILDDKINEPEDVEKYLGLSVLGVIPNRTDFGRKKPKYTGAQYYYSRHNAEQKK